MPVEILIHAFDHAKAVKGAPQDLREPTELMIHPWGNLETLPLFIRLSVNDETASSMTPFLAPWVNDIEFATISQNASQRRWRLAVAAKTVTDFGPDRGISARMIDHLIAEHGATLVSVRANRESAVIDVPLTDFDAVERDIADRFEIVLSSRRFRFAEGIVDAAIASAGRLNVTSSMILPGIVDRRA